MAHSDVMSWSLFRHGDVHDVLMDPDTFSNSSRHHAIPNALNGGEHTRYRHLLAPFFSSEAMAAFEPVCREIVVDASRQLTTGDAVNAITDLAEPVAYKSMVRFLGWPDAWWQRVQRWINGNQQATFARDRQTSKALAAEYESMVREALDAHRGHGADHDDVTSRLLQTELDGEDWTDDDIVDTLRNWVAGHGTVAGGIGILVFHLAGNQDLQQRLRNDPTLIPAAVDEILRSDGPLVSNRRTTTRDITIGGQSIPAGERLSLMWIAANRDPRAFEAPDAIQLDRDQTSNMLYGAGIHYCLGAPLARLEMQIAIEELLRHTSALSLPTPGEPSRETYPSNGIAELLVQASP